MTYKITYYTASNPEEVDETFHHLARIHYPQGGQMPFVITGRTREVVELAAQQTVEAEADRWTKSRNNPANQGKSVAPRKRREESPMPPHAGAVPDQIEAAMDAMDAREAAKAEPAPAAEPDFEEEF